MIADIILIVFSVSTIVLSVKVRKNSKRISKIQKAELEPDERVAEHERKIVELKESLNKSGTEMVNLTKRIGKVEVLVKDAGDNIKDGTKRISTLEKKVEKLVK